MSIAIQNRSFMCNHASGTPISVQNGAYFTKPLNRKRPSDFGVENETAPFLNILSAVFIGLQGLSLNL